MAEESQLKDQWTNSGRMLSKEQRSATCTTLPHMTAMRRPELMRADIVGKPAAKCFVMPD